MKQASNSKKEIEISIKAALLIGAGAMLASCMPEPKPRPTVPSLEYANSLRAMNGQAYNDEFSNSSVHYRAQAREETAIRGEAHPEMMPSADGARQDMRGQLRFAKDEGVLNAGDAAPLQVPAGSGSRVEHTPGRVTPPPSYYEYHSQAPNTRDYEGPLSLGDPGTTASLWRESRAGNDYFRDFRAYQPMDLLTIVVSEDAQGSKKANTEVKGKSSISAAISALLGIEKTVAKTNPNVDPSNLVSASTQNDYKGEGTTTRADSLKAHISAVVVETLPNGTLRIEGEKIISMNNEEQVMIISGLVRPRDINSANEVDSSKIANMRIDYYGNGTVGEAQYGGWASRVMRLLWPF